MDHFLVLDAAMEKVGLFRRELNALSYEAICLLIVHGISHHTRQLGTSSLTLPCMTRYLACSSAYRTERPFIQKIHLDIAQPRMRDPERALAAPMP